MSHSGDGDGHGPTEPETETETAPRRRQISSPRGARRPRHFGRAKSRLPAVLSVGLVAVVMGLGAFFGVLLSHQKTRLVHEPLPSEVITDTQGHQHLWGKILPPPFGKIYWGAFRLGAPYNTQLVSSLETEAGRRPAVLMWYQEWSDQPSFPVDEAAWLFDRGIVPMVTWEPWKPPAVFGTIVNNQPRFSLKRIADGAWDPYIEKYAREIKSYGGPVMLRPMHEMDGFWYPWSGTVQTSVGNSPTEYKMAWRHIWRVFRDVGATNVTWVWSVNHVSVPDTAANNISNYWPGKKFVDWIGFSGFNWGTASPFSVWKGFDSVERQRYDQLLHWNKPIALTEMGAPEVGGNKAQWIHQSFQDIFAQYPHLRLVIWYDKQDSPVRQWQINSSPASLAAFRQVIADPRVLNADAAQVTASPDVRG